MYGDYFKKLRKEYNLTLIELHEKSGVSKSYLHDIECEKIVPSDKIVAKLLDFYKLDDKKTLYLKKLLAFAKTPDLVKDEYKRLKKSYDLIKDSKDYNRSIPLFNYASAGINNSMVDIEYLENLDLNLDMDNLIATKIVGDSMEPRFVEGDIIILKKGVFPENNQMGLFILNDHPVFKIIKKVDEKIKLISINKDHKDILINKDDKLVVIGSFYKGIIH